jgi:hypothetical protein
MNKHSRRKLYTLGIITINLGNCTVKRIFTDLLNSNSFNAIELLKSPSFFFDLKCTMYSLYATFAGICHKKDRKLLPIS